MVKQCNNNSYPQENNEKYKEHFETFPFLLSDFQKHAIEGIVDGHHSLVCCPTGSGKTLPAEFAINYFTQKGKRVIYTSPLKALSNEKFYDFTKKYPHISFGVLTGDIKINPDAQVLIMTAEILLNTLFTKKHVQKNDQSIEMALSFEMDFDNELGCVIMDEIHFINDASRGKVWEETLMILPQHIQLIMLSATLDSPEKFATWIEARYQEENIQQKNVYLSTSNTRIVPLTHYSFITTTQGLFKQIKRDEVLTKEIKDLIDKPVLIQSASGQFNEPQYHKIKKTLELFQNKEVYVKRQYVINQVCKYMFENNLLPAVLFILSRKQIDAVSREITANLLEDDSKIPYIIQKECDDILRKLPNYEEYKQLPEYVGTVKLLEKGIGIHHSGIIPILREITEILFSKGYIKLLIATETFSVGLNMPIKTTVFTNLSKFDGSENRYFHSHEYMQCSGRAGRRGIDKIGTVIHLNNLFRIPPLTDYKQIMNGKPQTLISKFKLSYNLLLSLVDAGENELVDFVKKSMINTIICKEIEAIQQEIKKKEKQLIDIKLVISAMKTPREIIERYLECYKGLIMSSQKKRKEIDREMRSIKDEWKNIEQDKLHISKQNEIHNEINKLTGDYENTKSYLQNNLQVLLEFLKKDGFIDLDTTTEGHYSLTIKGIVASQTKELHCLVSANLWDSIASLTTKQLVKIFSCFSNVSVVDDFKTINYSEHLAGDEPVKVVLDKINGDYNKYQDFENDSRIDTGTDYTIHYDLLNYTDRWYDASNVEECKSVLQDIEKEKGIFLGEFVKAILKINTVSAEMEKIAETLGNVEFLHKLKEIPKNTLKFVATNQSLYV
jgi:superfamily II RNA helicase